MNSAYLILENGKVFKGKSFGATGEVLSEIVFSTGMIGYLEALTDKSFYGQTVVNTFPSIGNYGVISSDFEGDIIGPAAYIVKEWCQEPSNFRCEGNLDAFLKERGIVGLCGIDTRALTRILREEGTMNGLITTNPDGADIEAIKAYKIGDAVKAVSAVDTKVYGCENKKFTVALIDCGAKMSTVKQLNKYGCEVHLLPYTATLSDIKAIGADGVVVSDGPGDPADNTDMIKNIKEIFESGIPLFGIGLGHQMIALANGFKTEKLKYGHRGSSQPVKFYKTGNVHITTQNHGYNVCGDSIDDKIAFITFTNANDGSCEGLEYKNGKAFSVQFQPDDGGSPRDTSFLLEKFTKMMED